MKRLMPILLVQLTAACGLGGAPGNLSDYSLGAETYPNYPGCQQVYLKGKPIPGGFLRKIEKANETHVQGLACQGVTIIIDNKTGAWREGHL